MMRGRAGSPLYERDLRLCPHEPVYSGLRTYHADIYGQPQAGNDRLRDGMGRLSFPIPSANDRVPGIGLYFKRDLNER